MEPITIITHDFVEDLRGRHFSGRASKVFTELFLQIDKLYAGRHPGYQRSDTPYHDLHHACAASQATACLLDGHLKAGLSPSVTARHFELAVAASLLHDSGFIKETGDDEGTGAKYTLTHVERSVDCAARLLPSLGLDVNEVRVVQNAIRCTGVNANVAGLSFCTPAERYLGCVVGTTDILSQMAAPDYLERLPALYEEYVEAATHAGLQETGIGSYRSVEDLMRRTRSFYQDQVRRMFAEEWGGVYRELEHHFGNATNPYLTQIDANLRRIDRWLAERDTAGVR
jgi:hypothetical protein